MPVSLRDTSWPDFFVVEYRDGRRERLRRERDGMSFLPPPPGDTDPDYFLAWPAQQRSHPAKYGRLCELEDVDRIVDDAGAVLWSRSG